MFQSEDPSMPRHLARLFQQMGVVRSFSQKQALFDYALLRKLIESAAQETARLMGVEMTVALPYGFELFAKPERMYWPRQARRHYPVIGYPEDLPISQVERLIHFYVGELRYQLVCHFPVFADRLKFIQVHNCGHYSRVSVNPACQDFALMSIESFGLPKGEHIIEHYARYVVSLYGSMSREDCSLPEVRDFYHSKTRRNRLLQLFVMLDSLAAYVFGPSVLSMTDDELALYNQVYHLLRTEDAYELLRAVGYRHNDDHGIVALVPDEELIWKKLIVPRVARWYELLSSGPNPVMIRSPVYYNGDSVMEAMIGQEYADRMLNRIVAAYKQFPLDVGGYYQITPKNPSFIPSLA